MGTIIQDDKGNTSSFRVILLFFTALWFGLIVLWGIAFWVEMARDEPNYNGLAVLFGALVVQVLGMIAGHVIRKRYENETVCYEQDISDEEAENIIEQFKELKMHEKEDKPNEVKGFRK
jgi:hypothetical protein